MPDPEVNNNAPPVVETPPEPVVPDVEPTVPWENRMAEMERKLNESQQKSALLEYRLQQAQPRAANPYAAEIGEDIELDPELAEIASRYKPDDRKLIFRSIRSIGAKVAEQTAQRVGYQMLTQAEQVQRLQDNAPLQNEYRSQYQTLSNNPVFSGISDIAKQELALAKAEATLAKRGQLTIRNANGGSTLPNTTQQREPVKTEESKFVEEFTAKEENRWACKNVAKLDPDSDKGKEFMRNTALDEFRNGMKVYSGTSAVGRAIRAIQNAQVK